MLRVLLLHNVVDALCIQSVQARLRCPASPTFFALLVLADTQAGLPSKERRQASSETI